MVKRLAAALNANFDELEALMRAAGWLNEQETLIPAERPSTKQVISADPLLDDGAKRLLIELYDRLTRGASRGR